MWCGGKGGTVTAKCTEFESVCSDVAWDSPLTVYCDIQAALTLCQNRKERNRDQHICITHYVARDHVASRELQSLYCRSENHVSEALTKAMPRAAFEICLVGLGMLVLLWFNVWPQGRPQGRPQHVVPSNWMCMGRDKEKVRACEGG